MGRKKRPNTQHHAPQQDNNNNNNNNNNSSKKKKTRWGTRLHNKITGGEEKYLVKKYRPTKIYTAMAAFVKYTKSHSMFDATYVRWHIGVTTEKPSVFSTRVGGIDLGWGRGENREAAMDCACRAAFALVKPHYARDDIYTFSLDVDCLAQAPMNPLSTLLVPTPPLPINIEKNIEEVTSTLPMNSFMYHTTMTGAFAPSALSSFKSNNDNNNDTDKELTDMKLPLTYKRIRFCSNNINKEKQVDTLSQSSPSSILSSAAAVSSPISPVPLLPYSFNGVVAKKKTEVVSSPSPTSTPSSASEENFVVHARFGGGNSSICNHNSILFKFLTDRFKQAYQREPTVPISCMVREELNDALVVCHNEEDCDRLLQFKSRNFNGYDIELTRCTGTMMTYGNNNNNNNTNHKNNIHALSSSSSLLSSNDKSGEYAMLLREYQQLQFQHTDTMQQNKQLTSKCENLQEQLDEAKLLSERTKHREWEQHQHQQHQHHQQQRIIESLQRELANSDNTILEQTTTIHEMREETQTILQRLNDEVMIRHQAEHLFEEETVELRNLMEQEISLRCQAKQEQVTTHQQWQQEMKQRRNAEAEKEKYKLLLSQQEKQRNITTTTTTTTNTTTNRYSTNSSIPKKEECIVKNERYS